MNTNCLDILREDTLEYIDILKKSYNISMVNQKVQKMGSVVYLGEFYVKNNKYIIKLEIFSNRSIIQVFLVSPIEKTCVFQKSYTTNSDLHALSKSVSLFNFLDKLATSKS